MKALGRIVAHTGRCDVPALLQVIRLLLQADLTDGVLEQLRAALVEAGVRFTAIDDRHIRFDLHGHPHKPATPRQAGEMLAQLRQIRLA